MDNIREWTGLEFAKSQRAVENREKMEKTGCEIICGAPCNDPRGYGIDDDDDALGAVSSFLMENKALQK